MKTEIEVVRGDVALGTLPEGDALELLRIGFFRPDDQFRREGDAGLLRLAELWPAEVKSPDPESPLPIGPAAPEPSALSEPAAQPSWLTRAGQSIATAASAVGAAGAAGVESATQVAGTVASSVGSAAGRLRAWVGQGPSTVNRATSAMLEGFVPQIRAAIDTAVGAAGTAGAGALESVRAGIRDDDFMRKTFGAVYDCLPKPVCRFVNEEKFLAFCLEHRKRLLD